MPFTDVRRPSGMQMADISLRRRKVRCPGCLILLIEPEIGIYECPKCSICLEAKGTSSKSQKKSLQGPLNESNGLTTCQQEAGSVIELEPGLQDQLINDETEKHLSINRSIRQQEQIFGPGTSEPLLMFETGKEQYVQLQSISAMSISTTDSASKNIVAIGEEGMDMRTQKTLNSASKEVTSANKGGLPDETQMSRDHLIQQHSLSEGDDKAAVQLPFEGEMSGDVFAGECVDMESKKNKDTADLGMQIVRTEENGFAGKGVGVAESQQEECNILDDKNDQNFEAEIMRDNDCELSFKYISRLKSNVQLAQTNRTHRLAKPSSEVPEGEGEVATVPDLSLEISSLNSDEYESYSSLSESASLDGSDSEFYFPAPSEESIQPANLFLQQKVPEAPHQLEWKDTHYDTNVSTFQSVNGSTFSSVGVVGKIALSVPTIVEQGDKEEIAEDVLHIKEDLPKKIVSRGLDDRTETVSDFVCVERDNVFFGVANTEGMVAPERYNEIPVLGAGSGSKADFEVREGSSVDSLNDQKSIESRDKLLESSRIISSGAAQILQLKPSSILKGHMQPSVPDSCTRALSGGEQISQPKPSSILNGHMQPSVADPCTRALSGGEKISHLKPSSILKGHVQPSVTDTSMSPLLGVSQVLNVQEDAKLIMCVANLALKDLSTSSSHDNAGDIVEGNKKIERPATRAFVADAENSQFGQRKELDLAGVQQSNRSYDRPATRAFVTDAENERFGQRKELESARVQSPLVIEQNNTSYDGAMQSGGYHRQDHSREEMQRKEAGKMLDAKLHRKNYSADEAQVSNRKHVASNQAGGKVHNEGIYISRVEGSLNTHQRHVQAAPLLAGPLLQLPNSQADLHSIEQTMHTVNAPAGCPTSSQPLRFNSYFDGSRPFASTVCSYQVPSHPLMLPMAMPGHTCSNRGFHPAGPVCMAYAHCQHPHMSQLHMPSCLFCSSTMGHHQGHTELGNCHHGYQVQVPSMLCHAQTCFPSQIPHMHETSMAVAKPLISSVRNPKHYAPLPQEGRTAPYVVCSGCSNILEVPVDLSPSGEGAQKLRCSGCGKVSKFSPLKSIKKSHTMGLQSSAVGSTRASTSSPPSFEFMVQNRELPVPNVGQSIESSYGKSLHSQYQRGSVSSRHCTDNGVSSAVSNRNLHSLQDEMTFKIKPSQDEPDTKIPDAINNHSSEDEFFFRSLSRKSEFDSSRRLFSGFKTMSSRFGVNNDAIGLIGNDDVPLQCTVDEKEEGLDFGAPRPSDGESLDQRSPESRMRSPENFELVDQVRHRSSFGDEEICLASENQQQFGSKCNNTAQERWPSTSLFALLNQSTKFEINMEERVSYEESTSALRSPASDSPVENQRSNARNKGIGRPSNLTTKQFVRKGPRYIAALLTRSLKNRVND